jgi:hypothetical protein
MRDSLRQDGQVEDKGSRRRQQEECQGGGSKSTPMAIALLLHWFIDSEQPIETVVTETPTVTMVLRASFW